MTKFDPTIMPENITPDYILAWREFHFNQKNGTAVTWNNYVRHLKPLFNLAIEQNLITTKDNPFKKMSVREYKSRKKTLSITQLQLIKEYLSTDLIENKHPIREKWFWLCLTEVYKFTGMRLNQLLALTIDDIDLTNSLINLCPEISKNYTEYYIPIAKQLICYLTLIVKKAKEHKIPPNEQLFNINRFDSHTRRQNQVMSENQVSHFFQHLSYHCQFRISAHRFRHTIATELMKTPEKNLYAAQKLLGHKNIQTTLNYIEYDPKSVKDCVELLDF